MDVGHWDEDMKSNQRIFQFSIFPEQLVCKGPLYFRKSISVQAWALGAVVPWTRGPVDQRRGPVDPEIVDPEPHIASKKKIRASHGKNEYSLKDFLRASRG